jgi:hypothetical protein
VSDLAVVILTVLYAGHGGDETPEQQDEAREYLATERPRAKGSSSRGVRLRVLWTRTG